MTITLQEYFVGIDVSKDKLDVAILGQKTVTQSTNTRRGIAGLIRQMHKLNPKLIVVEATGGYEEALVLGMYEAGLPVALVSPQWVRQYARADYWPRRTVWMHKTWRSTGKTSSRACLWGKVRRAGVYPHWWEGENNRERCRKPRKTVCGWPIRK